MFARTTALLTVAVASCLAPVDSHAMNPYFQDFEGLIQADPQALEFDGWLVFGNVFLPNGDFDYGYGPFAAPNHEFGFSAIADGQGGVDQGAQQLSVYSDYNNADHGNDRIIESNVFQEQLIEASDVGLFWVFEFQSKKGNIEGASEARAFIKTIDPDNGFALTNLVVSEQTNIPDEWGGDTIELYIIPELVDQLFQFGFLNTATEFEGSGIFYDNINFFSRETSSVTAENSAIGGTLDANYPNPFEPSTQINFSLAATGEASLSIFDIEGRKVATLEDGVVSAGEHSVSWDGTTDEGVKAAAGTYFYVLETEKGRLTRQMTLLK